ncbi:FeoA family protein [Schinkia azotoformans]|uniref:FeoA family protein n=1 Tax=Schinkia azotoformans TaxID=1454 RepID=UPI002DB773B3|nr:FeoA family protein [Schinkia azotoformans]MEC1718137.1 FeoA family protein [Schinkia azotoformans]MEC1742101.1 FeoA family protein [Schinkia azotoformans]MEC1748035.1 FeoA family protein [Schinkia azotoformans]MEC1765011.1 FeoA family protein [Schinkia azotoformans]MEC1785937.1 FeoA family protein [Schinkia azotoformans]
MIKNSIPLNECETDDHVVIESMLIQGVMRRRLLDLGFVKGAQIEVLQKSPLGDPAAYRVNNTTIALRKEESSQILVRKA